MPASLSGSSRRTRVLVGTLAAAVVLALVYLAGLLTPRLLTPGDGSPEAGFARDMAAHHAQAVEMGLLVYAHGSSEAVRRLGYDIATAQQYQIGVMDTWLKDWGLPLTSDRPPMSWMPAGERQLTSEGLMPGMATQAEMGQLRKASGKDADVLFCQLMQRHHLGGLHMVDVILRMSDNDQVRALATSMRQGQSGELAVLQSLLEDLGAAAK